MMLEVRSLLIVVSQSSWFYYGVVGCAVAMAVAYDEQVEVRHSLVTQERIAYYPLNRINFVKPVLDGTLHWRPGSSAVWLLVVDVRSVAQKEIRHNFETQ